MRQGQKSFGKSEGIKLVVTTGFAANPLMGKDAEYNMRLINQIH